MFTDSHCHLTYQPLFENVETLVKNCLKNNVDKLLTISTDLQTSKNSILIANKFTNVYCAIGIHPNSSNSEFLNIKEIINISKKSKKIIGIGETGLDFFKYKGDKNIQIESFLKHIDLAKKLKVPVIVHNRDADKDLLKIILENSNSKNSIKFLIHCFTGNLEFAKKLLDNNCILSFSGIITFKKSWELRDVIKQIPLNKMMIETDSPFLSPEPFRGKSNTPLNLIYIAKTIAELKKISTEEVGRITTKNFNNFFKL